MYSHRWTVTSLDPMVALPRLTVGPVRRALLALALGGFGIGTGEFVTLGLLPNIAHSLHVRISQAGHLISAYAFGVVVGAPRRWSPPSSCLRSGAARRWRSCSPG
jgi:hypothetical protein